MRNAFSGTHVRWAGTAAVAVALALPLAAYLLTLAPTVYTLDTPELATAAYTLGIAHAPGYPLYTLVGWLFSHAFVVRDVAYRLNLLSALMGAGTVVLVYLIARTLTRRTLPSLAAALMLAFSYWFWANSLVAEVYTLDTLLLAGMLLALLQWRAKQQPQALFCASLLFGLSLANRTTSLLFLPAIVLYLLLSPKPRRAAVWLGAPLLVALGLLVYLYIPLDFRSDPDYVWSTMFVFPGQTPPDLATPGGFWYLVSAADFRPFVFDFGLVESLGNLVQYVGWLAGSFMGVGLVLGLIGIWRQYQSHRWELVLLAGIFLPTVVFYTNYNVADREMMVLPSYVVFALWIAVGWCEASDALPSLFEDARARAIAPALMLLLPLVALLVNYPLLDLSGEHGIREDGEQLLTQAEPNPVIASWWIDVAPLLYLQKVEGMRPDAELIFSSAGDKNYLLLMAQINVGHRPFYVRRDKEFLDERYDLVPIEGSSASGKSWYQVFEKGTTRAAGDD